LQNHAEALRAFVRYLDDGGRGGAAGSLGGCSAVVASTLSQCDVDSDCARRGGEFAPATCHEGTCRAAPSLTDGADWSCLGRRRAAAKETVRLTVRVLDLLDNTPIADATVRACSRFDVPCATPVAPDQVVDQEGRATLTLPTAEAVPGRAGFAGHILVTAPGYSPLARAFSPPLIDDAEDVVQLALPDATQGLQALLGFAPDPSLGLFFLLNHDCQGRTVADGTFSIDAPGATLVYNADGVPVTAARSTDGGGSAFLINAPTSTFIIRVSNQGPGQTAEVAASGLAGLPLVLSVRPDPAN
jgi:hypothetical protein